MDFSLVILVFFIVMYSTSIIMIDGFIGISRSHRAYVEAREEYQKAEKRYFNFLAGFSEETGIPIEELDRQIKAFNAGCKNEAERV